jgi:hypothetical protein
MVHAQRVQSGSGPRRRAMHRCDRAVACRAVVNMSCVKICGPVTVRRVGVSKHEGGREVYFEVYSRQAVQVDST